MRRRIGGQGGVTGLELLFVMAFLATIGGATVPPVLRALDDYRAAAAARYVATRLQRVRMEAMLRSTSVGAKFFASGSGYAFAVYVDGNRNGVLTTDIQSGVDRQIGVMEHLPDNFSGVEFGTIPGLPPVEAGGSLPGTDPIHLGTSDIACFSASGSSSSGSLYLKSRTKQYVVRIYGDTGRTRLLVFDATAWRWMPL